MNIITFDGIFYVVGCVLAGVNISLISFQKQRNHD